MCASPVIPGPLIDHCRWEEGEILSHQQPPAATALPSPPPSPPQDSGVYYTVGLMTGTHYRGHALMLSKRRVFWHLSMALGSA